MEENLEGGLCSVCGTASTTICSRCYDTYCSAKCQVLDWPKHRIMCFPMPVLVDRRVILQKSKSAKHLENKGPRIANSAASLHKEQIKKPKETEVILQSTDDHTQPKLPISMNQQLEVPRKPHFLKNKEESEIPTQKISEKTEEPIIVIKSKEVKLDKEFSGEQESATRISSTKDIRSMLMKAKLSSSISDSKENGSLNKIVAKQEPWMKCVPVPESSEAIEVIVTNFTLNINTGYVILGKDYDACISLLEKLQKSSVTKKPTLSAKEIKVGELYAVQNTDTMNYRGSVLAEEGKNVFRVKLIDFGDEILLEATKFRPIPEIFNKQPAYAIPVTFKNNKKRLKVEQKLNVRFIEINEERNTVEIILNVKQMGLLTWFMKKEISKFDATLRYVLDENVMTIGVQLPEKYEQVFDVLNKELQESVASLEASKTVKPGMMIAIKRADQQFTRGIVTSIDYTANVCVTYLCDYGTFENLIPIPEQVKVISEKVLQVPSKTMIMKINEVVVKDKKQFNQQFYKKDASYSLNFTTKDDKIIAEVLLDGTVLATAQLFDTIPNCTDLGLNLWYVQSPSQTYVKLLRTAVDTKVRAIICPIDKHEIFNTPIQAISVDLSPLSKAPDIGDVVVHTSSNRVKRCVVQKKISNDIIEIRDLDGADSYQCEWKKLEAASKFLRSLPVYTMAIVLSDCDDFESYDIEEVKSFFFQPVVKNKEYVLSYEKGLGCDAKLVINSKTGETLGTMLKAHMLKIKAEKLAAEEAKKLELEAKRKAEEEKRHQEEIQRKNQEEKERQEAEALRKSQIEAIQKALEAENNTVKIFFNDIPTIPLPVNKVSRLIIVEIDKKKGLVAVCEDTPDNVGFLSDILSLCDNHMNTPKGKSSVGYSPTQNEMIMALFEDGSWYRAVCLDQEKTQFTTLLVDFGTIMDTTSDKLAKFPESLKTQSIRTHFASGLSDEMLSKIEPFSKHKFHIDSDENGIYSIKSI